MWKLGFKGFVLLILFPGHEFVFAKAALHPFRCLVDDVFQGVSFGYLEPERLADLYLLLDEGCDRGLRVGVLDAADRAHLITWDQQGKRLSKDGISIPVKEDGITYTEPKRISGLE